MGAMTREDDVATQLARLTARGLQITGDHGGGHPAWLTPMDIAACIAGIPEPHASLLMVKMMGDRSVVPSAIAALSDDLMRRGCALNPVLLGRIVIDLHLKDRLCSICKGRANITKKQTGLVVKCDGCDGTGRKAASDAEIARRAQLSVERYRKHCKTAVESVQLAIEIGEVEAMAHVFRRMRRE